MERRYSIVAVALLVVLVAVACQKASPTAPTSTSAAAQTLATAPAATPTAASPVVSAQLRPGMIDVRGVIKDLDAAARTFWLTTRERSVKVQIHPATIITHGPNPRNRIRPGALKNGMAVGVAGKLEDGVLHARWITVIPTRPGE
jgi:hypothetical protein